MPLIPFWSAWFPPEPEFTEKDLPSLQGKVYIVTGAASGVGLSLARFLYQAGGTVYLACRSPARCEEAIEAVLEQTRNISSDKNKKLYGELKSMVLDLSDLATVKPAVQEFLKRETRLDVLFNNAAVMMPPKGSTDKQGHNLEIGTNCLAPYLLTTLLEPILIRTAALPNTPRFSVRVVFVVGLLQRMSPYELICDENGVPQVLDVQQNYFQSKVGATWLAAKFGARLNDKGVMSTSVHPGCMATPLQRHLNPITHFIWDLIFRKGPDYGAYSEIFAGFYDIPESHNGGHLMAWGRLADMPDITAQGLKSIQEGGTGRAQTFFDYCDREIKTFL